MGQEIKEGHSLNIGGASNIWSAISFEASVAIDETRKSLSELLVQAGDKICYAVESLSRGEPILDVRSPTEIELTGCVIIPRGERWFVVAKEWFDKEIAPPAVTGEVEVPEAAPPTTTGEPEPTVDLRKSFRAQIGDRGNK